MNTTFRSSGSVYFFTAYILIYEVNLSYQGLHINLSILDAVVQGDIPHVRQNKAQAGPFVFPPTKCLNVQH